MATDPGDLPAPDAASPFPDVVIVSMLGGPGSGKGTQCKQLAQSFDVEHIGMGDFLRAEADREDSKYGALIRRNIMEGALGPIEMAVGLVASHIRGLARRGKRVFVVDGFPRYLEQAKYFEDTVSPIQLVVALQCPESVLFDRLEPRARVDDKRDIIQKRIDTFNNTTSQVVEYFRAQGKLRVVDADRAVEAVSSELEDIFSEIAKRVSAATVQDGDVR